MTAEIQQASVAVDEPIISVDRLGVQFNKQSRHRSVRELLFKGRRGRVTNAFWALRNVSFDVQAGESIGVVGRNGQGKSTLLKLVAGVMLPDEGSVTLRGGVAPLIEMTGGFVADLTARDNIYLAAGLHGMTRSQIDAKFDDIVDFAELRDFLDTPFRHLSSGMRVRLAFSVVSQLDEPILLVDEVLAVGDSAFREKCYERITELLAGGRTLFFVSHAAGDLKRFCQRGLLLKGGRLVQDGPIEEILDAYRASIGPKHGATNGDKKPPAKKKPAGKQPAKQPAKQQQAGKRPAKRKPANAQSDRNAPEQEPPTGAKPDAPKQQTPATKPTQPDASVSAPTRSDEPEPARAAEPSAERSARRTG